MNRFRKTLLAVTALALISTAAAVPSVRADTEARIAVSAEINEPASLAIELCDVSADFGTGLNSEGNVREVGSDIFVSSPGESEGEGVYYYWNPSCGPHVRATTNLPAMLSGCGRQIGNPNDTPDVTIDGGDVGIIIIGGAPETYAGWSAAPVLPLCSDTGGITLSFDDEFEGNTIPGLRIDDGIRSGTFAAAVLFSVTP